MSVTQNSESTSDQFLPFPDKYSVSSKMNLQIMHSYRAFLQNFTFFLGAIVSDTKIGVGCNKDL